jgi:hypothetical protein
MNERIRELFEQAHIQPPATVSGQFAFTPPKTFSPEKFAEMIVRECALQCNHNDDMDRILEHFGVEE